MLCPDGSQRDVTADHVWLSGSFSGTVATPSHTMEVCLPLECEVPFKALSSALAAILNKVTVADPRRASSAPKVWSDLRAVLARDGLVASPQAEDTDCNAQRDPPYVDADAGVGVDANQLRKLRRLEACEDMVRQLTHERDRLTEGNRNHLQKANLHPSLSACCELSSDALPRSEHCDGHVIGTAGAARDVLRTSSYTGSVLLQQFEEGGEQLRAPHVKPNVVSVGVETMGLRAGDGEQEKECQATGSLVRAAPLRAAPLEIVALQAEEVAALREVEALQAEEVAALREWRSEAEAWRASDAQANAQEMHEADAAAKQAEACHTVEVLAPREKELPRSPPRATAVDRGGTHVAAAALATQGGLLCREPELTPPRTPRTPPQTPPRTPLAGLGRSTSSTFLRSDLSDVAQVREVRLEVARQRNEEARSCAGQLAASRDALRDEAARASSELSSELRVAGQREEEVEQRCLEVERLRSELTTERGDRVVEAAAAAIAASHIQTLEAKLQEAKSAKAVIDAEKGAEASAFREALQVAEHRKGESTARTVAREFTFSRREARRLNDEVHKIASARDECTEVGKMAALRRAIASEMEACDDERYAHAGTAAELEVVRDEVARLRSRTLPARKSVTPRRRRNEGAHVRTLRDIQGPSLSASAELFPFDPVIEIHPDKVSVRRPRRSSSPALCRSNYLVRDPAPASIATALRVPFGTPPPAVSGRVVRQSSLEAALCLNCRSRSRSGTPHPPSRMLQVVPPPASNLVGNMVSAATSGPPTPPTGARGQATARAAMAAASPPSPAGSLSATVPGSILGGSAAVGGGVFPVADSLDYSPCPNLRTPVLSTRMPAVAPPAVAAPLISALSQPDVGAGPVLSGGSPASWVSARSLSPSRRSRVVATAPTAASVGAPTFVPSATPALHSPQVSPLISPAASSDEGFTFPPPRKVTSSITRPQSMWPAPLRKIHTSGGITQMVCSASSGGGKPMGRPA